MLEWDGGSDHTVVVFHGYLDCAYSFAPFCAELAKHGHHVVAFDWRGHGQTDWIGAGGYYHFPDYALDVSELLPQLKRKTVSAIGHSMGGTVLAMCAGSFPAGTFERVVLVEGLGPPQATAGDWLDRFQRFLSDVARVRSKSRKRFTAREAAKKLRDSHGPELSEALAELLAIVSTRPVEMLQAADQRLWTFDPLHQTAAPLPFIREAFLSLLSAITCPVLVVQGERGYAPPDLDDRVRQISSVKRLTIPTVSHMMHWYEPRTLAAAVEAFLEG